MKSEIHPNYLSLKCLGLHEIPCSNNITSLTVLDCKCPDITSVFVACNEHQPVILENQAACKHCSGIKYCHRCDTILNVLFIYDVPNKEIVSIDSSLNLEFAKEWITRDPKEFEEM